MGRRSRALLDDLITTGLANCSLNTEHTTSKRPIAVLAVVATGRKYTLPCRLHGRGARTKALITSGYVQQTHGQVQPMWNTPICICQVREQCECQEARDCATVTLGNSRPDDVGFVASWMSSSSEIRRCSSTNKTRHTGVPRRARPLRRFWCLHPKPQMIHRPSLFYVHQSSCRPGRGLAGLQSGSRAHCVPRFFPTTP